MGLVLLWVWEFIGIMPRLTIIVANAGRKFFGLGSMLMCLLVPQGLRTTMGKLIHQLLK
jgi:hypothetical protein